MPFEDDEDPYHARLKARPVLWAIVGVSHTLLTAGIVFGWASLLPVVRQEGVNMSPSDFARVFTHGAVGNYLSSLPFGLLLDRFGPKTCGATASVLFALGLVLCAKATESVVALDAGFALLGFAGPAIQLPTLHLARLFPGEAREGSSGGAALIMSAQAGAFDGGTLVFALFSMAANLFGMTTSTFFRLYLVVPAFTLLTAMLVWPHEILPEPTLTRAQKRKSYVGAGSPYLSPGSLVLAHGTASLLKDAPLSTILTQPPFYCLAAWVGVHILKLNFVVATINDQLDYSLPDDPNLVNTLIGIFGAMLPFGFVVLPAVAYWLSRSTMVCFQIANTVGLLYGAVLTFQPDQPWYDVLIVFTSVATSRQLVYSTVFHQTGELFGFKNYGVLLGLTNVVVSGVSMVQGPLVEWAEASQDYFGPNFLLLVLTVPLYVIVCWTVPKPPKTIAMAGESMPLIVPATRRPRTMSDVVMET